jgi:diguanylate cyclase (GGDEF)-like protein
MFWRKAAKGPEPTKAVEEPLTSGEVSVDDVLDAAADILRALGKHAFTVGEEDKSLIAESFERCAEHVLIAAPLDKRADDKSPPPQTSRREWRRVVRFVADHRKKEQTFVERSTKEAREAIWALVDSVGRACVEHGKADEKLRSQAARLGKAATTESITELKREATEFASSVVQFLEEQNQRLTVETRTLRERLANLETQLDEAKKEGGTDPLTKLANRRVFDATLAQQAALATVTTRPLSLVMIDIDRFKTINDKHGHPAGDLVLREIADCLVRAFPRRTDLVARYGGEELAVVLPDTSPQNARALAERMVTLIRSREIDVGSAKLKVTVSVGLAVHAAGEAPTDLLERADRRLYAAKEAGRDRIVDCEPAGAPDAPAGARGERLARAS